MSCGFSTAPSYAAQEAQELLGVITGYGDQTRLDVERSEKRNCAMALVVMDYVGSALLFEVQPRLGPIKTGLPPNRANTPSMPLQIMD